MNNALSTFTQRIRDKVLYRQKHVFYIGLYRYLYNGFVQGVTLITLLCSIEIFI